MQGTVHGNLTCVSLQVEAGSMISGQANVGDMKLKQTSRV
jgi:cytoskeletal protein CcmA (bactofilin family)